jgi:N-methylhydantoinase A
LHAAEVAEAMEMRRVIVPPHPGLMSAIGLLAADIRADFGITCLTDATPSNWRAVAAALAELLTRAHAWSADEQLDPSRLVINRMLELRYRGQSSELRIPLPDDAADPLSLAVAGFHAEHQRRFGYAMAERPVEIVTARLTAVATRPTPPPEAIPAPGDTPRPVHGARSVWFAATGFVATPIHDRGAIQRTDRIAGPAIIEQMDTTTVVPPGWTATVDAAANLLLQREDV